MVFMKNQDSRIGSGRQRDAEAGQVRGQILDAVKLEHNGEQNRDRGRDAEDQNRVPALIFALCAPPHAVRGGARHHVPNCRQKNQRADIGGDQEARRGAGPA
jgi:hypothetical protein